MLGAKPPADVDVRGLEKNVTKQADIVAHLKKSFDHARAAVKAVSEEQLGDAIKMFGQAATKRKAMVTLVEHASEHLGSIDRLRPHERHHPAWSQ